MADDPGKADMDGFSRAMMLPWRIFSRPTSGAFLDGLRPRNVLLDVLFYDVRRIGGDEAMDLAPWKVGEGAILIVPPSDAGRLTVCATPEDFVAAGGAAIPTLTVAGVGASALGTAAFARNVADAVGAPVAAVVSGYGLADLVDEASDGFLWFSGLAAMNELRDHLDRSLDWMRASGLAAFAGEAEPAHADRDSDVVLALIQDERLNFDLIVAHSKGNAVVGDALHALQRANRARSERLAETVRVVSISARRRVPRAWRRVIEVVGRWDLVGDFATRRDAPPDVVVPDAWHHTNTDLYGHLPVTRVLKDVLADPAR